MLKRIPVVLLSLVFVTVSLQPALAEDKCNPPKGPVAYCNKQAGGSCNPKTGWWTVSSHQIALKNECVWRLSRGEPHGPIR
jgi:hypothetical protein